MPGLRPRTPSTASDESSTAPEALLLSAFLEVGEFDPQRFGVLDTDIVAWSQVWSMCAEYASATNGQAPPISLVTKTFPDFEITRDVRAEYAASKVREAAAEREIRERTREAITALNDGDLSDVYEVLSSIRPRTEAKAVPASVFDVREVAARHNVKRIAVPYPALQRASGGIAAGELWYIAARSGHGKTWDVMHYAGHAARQGERVAVLSLEMPHAQVSMRGLTTMTRGDRDLLRLLRSSEEEDWQAAVDAIKESTPGEVHVFDHSHGMITTIDFVRSIINDYDLVIIDHMGLMTSGGARAVDDWRIQAAISNELRALVLASSSRVLAAVQVNREGSRGRASRPPTLTSLAGSDALGQDGDVVITQRRWSKSVKVHSAEKIRDGEELRFHSHFDPRRGRFGEMTYEQAVSVHDTEGDFREEDQ